MLLDAHMLECAACASADEPCDEGQQLFEAFERDGAEGYRVRTSSLIDVPRVREMLQAGGWRGPACPSPSVIARASTDQHAFVATDVDDAPIGFARIITDGETVSYLCELIVEPDWRRQGVARALIDACTRAVPNARLDLLSSEAGKPFYAATGFLGHAGYRRWP